MPTKFIPVVDLGLRALLNYPQGQRIIRIDPSGDFTKVNLQEVGTVPAVIALRFDLGRIDGHKQHWGVSFVPYARRLLMKLFGTASVNEVTDNPLIQTMRNFVKQIGSLEPPVGTVIQSTFTFSQEGEPQWDWYASSTEAAERKRKAVIQHNDLVLGRYWGIGWLLQATGWKLTPVPDEPGEDTWLKENRSEIELAAQSLLLAVLESLWKAVFMNDVDVRSTLRSRGFQVDLIGQTHLGVGEFKKVIQAARKGHLTLMTQVALPGASQQNS